jgi:hypothetical protein
MSLSNIDMTLQSSGVLSAISSHLRQMWVKWAGEKICNRWAEGVGRQKMYEDLGDDFFGQNQDGVLVGIEAFLCQRFLDPQRERSRSKI